jgi:hypothetical protein
VFPDGEAKAPSCRRSPRDLWLTRSNSGIASQAHDVLPDGGNPASCRSAGGAAESSPGRQPGDSRPQRGDSVGGLGPSQAFAREGRQPEAIRTGASFTGNSGSAERPSRRSDP